MIGALRDGARHDAKVIGGAFLRAAVPLLICLSVWWPDFDHFRIDRDPLPAAIIQQVVREPAPGVIEEVGNIQFLISLGIPEAQRAQAARAVLEGRLEAVPSLSMALPLLGWPDDLKPGGPSFQLAMSSLAVEDLLLREFERTGEQQFYLRARERILAFAEWESRQRRPVEFLWNDHAVGARVSVFVRLWKTLRADPGATVAQHTELLALVARSGELLAKPSQFTVRTNHGVMQNLALLQIAAAFPALPKARQWRDLAVERLELQLGFYVSDEGVVLEHSAEYHVFGNLLIRNAARLIRLTGMEPSVGLAKALVSTATFNQQMKRPDGSLPLVGNTAGGRRPAALAEHPEAIASASAPPPTDDHLYPLSGYAILSTHEPTPSQLFVAWAKHDRHGHKHADEPSLHFWSRGFDWLTATGYWPYGARGYAEANGWAGANAPHGKGESAQSQRNVRLLGFGGAGIIRAVDIENTRLSGLQVRRQVVLLAPEQFLVLDTVLGATAPTDTLWTVDPRLTLMQVDRQHFEAKSNQGGYALHINTAFDASAGALVGLYRGSWSPFAGWVVNGPEPSPASTMMVQRKPGSSTTATLMTVSNQAGPDGLVLASGGQPEEWLVDIRSPSGVQRVQRRGTHVEVTDLRGTTSVQLTAPADMAGRQATLRSAMVQAIKKYPQWRPLGKFRQRVYLAAAGLWAAIEIFLVLLARWRLRRAWMDAGILVGWAGAYWWIHFHYLV